MATVRSNQHDLSNKQQAAFVDAVNKLHGTAAAAAPAYRAFVQVHVDVAVGGTINSASSPSDSVFWLHHANIDRLWAQWQTAHPKAKTPNSATVLQPSPLLGVKIATQLDTATLGYSYA